jgi:FimV-like protein
MSLSPKHFLRLVALSCLSGLLASQALAIQISSPVLYSRQGEQLKLSFHITEISAEEEQGLKVNLASAKVYQSTQIAKVEGLDNLKFDISKQADGNYKVMMTGSSVISQPHADMIIDLEWSSGRRYINLGVDFEEAATATAAKPSDKPPAQDTAPVQQGQKSEFLEPEKATPALEKTGTDPQTTEPIEEKPAVSAPAEASAKQTDKPAAYSTEPDASTSTPAAPQRNAIEVQKGESASKLLMAHPAQGVSLDQLLLAMLHMNPNAFVNDNVNRLVAGALVTLPTADDAGAYDPKFARENIRLQALDFKAYRASLAANVPTAKQANTSKRESSGNLKADVATSTKTPDDHLTLSKPGDSEADKLSRQLQEEDAAKQVKEVQDNLSQLGQLSQAMARFKQGFVAKFPMVNAAYDQSIGWVKRYVFELIGAIALSLALFVSYSVLRERKQDEDEYSEQISTNSQEQNHNQELSLPPDLNLDLDDEPVIKPATPVAPEAPLKSDASPRQNVIDPGEDPFLMRLELADELWRLGQKQTALALAQEVADQTHGETRDMAQRWLKDHS